MDTLCKPTSGAAVAAPSTLNKSGQACTDRAIPRGVLVVDDDASIRQLLNAALRQHGFAVWMACHGEEALALYRLHGGDIGLVLLDVRMPILDGPQTVAALRQLEPALTFSFMSGHSGDYSSEQLLGLGAAYVFEKPFSVAQVLEKVEQLTERASSR